MGVELRARGSRLAAWTRLSRSAMRLSSFRRAAQVSASRSVCAMTSLRFGLAGRYYVKKEIKSSPVTTSLTVSARALRASYILPPPSLVSPSSAF